MKRLCQVSGGYDSAAALLLTLQTYPQDEVLALQVDCGQKYFANELSAAKYLLSRFKNTYKIEHKVIECEVAQGQAATDGKSVAAHYVPVRNLVLAALSVNYALAYGAKEIVVGMKRDFSATPDPFFYRDSGGTFYAAMNAVSSTATEFTDFPPPLFVAPLNRNGNPYTKTECLQLLLDAGMDLQQLWSCSSDFFVQCGECHMCEGVKKAMQPLGMTL